MADPAYIVDGVLTDGEAWVGLATTTLGSDTASITFTSADDGSSLDWSQFMDLVVVAYARSDRVATDDRLNVKISGDTAAGTQYLTQGLRGNGSSASAALWTYGGDTYGGCTVGIVTAASATANIFATSVTTFFDVNSGKYKSLISQSAADQDGSGEVNLYAGTHKKTPPITSLLFYPAFGSNLKDGSTISLFGVLPRMVA